MEHIEINKSVQLLDCTIRDGGYYVDWDFDESLIRKYLAAVEIAKVDIVEIGFRFSPKNKFLGAFAYSTDQYLNTLPLPEGISIAVMVNAAELINYTEGLNGAIIRLFDKKSESPVDIVRIATHAKDISACEELVKIFDGLGYRVFLNVMQVDSLKSDELTHFSKEIASWGVVETLYFADSFGNMEPESVQDTVEALKNGWSGNIGFHAHDNKGQALSNCISALKCGVNYIDSTLSGMGRGAGNAKTENMLVELALRSYGEYFADAIFPLVMQDFQKLKDRYKWGPNIYY